MCDLATVFENKFRRIENLIKNCFNLERAIKYCICLNSSYESAKLQFHARRRST